MCADTTEAHGHPSDDVAEVCVGVVVALEEPLASEITGWRLSFGDAMAAVIPAHITLVTTTPALGWADTTAHVREVARTQCPFTVTLRGTESFRPVSPVVYLKVEDGYQDCVDLHGKLQAGPLARDLPFDYHPHITVAHDISEEGMDEAQEKLKDFRAEFTVSSMGLYEHDSSGVWQLKEELEFGGATDARDTTGTD
ncbi:2'-5' RNA ligase family protein [Arthrobacter sp. 35W]|uniref:2'-5' RNA ligase family protein n=1 Tax=Arthrobacter sp. 35W TaxID=1132441 RepID=UPI00040C7893|nr:2'-5' RNA ligase family protein [Arthrobacter sp. 35W]